MWIETTCQDSTSDQAPRSGWSTCDGSGGAGTAPVGGGGGGGCVVGSPPSGSDGGGGFAGGSVGVERPSSFAACFAVTGFWQPNASAATTIAPNAFIAPPSSRLQAQGGKPGAGGQAVPVQRGRNSRKRIALPRMASSSAQAIALPRLGTEFPLSGS